MARRTNHETRPLQVAELPPPAVPVCLDPPIARIEGDTLAWALPPLHALAEDIGSTVTLAELPADIGGSYDVRSQAITLNTGRSVNGQVATLIHELGHALVRHDRDDEGPRALTTPPRNSSSRA